MSSKWPRYKLNYAFNSGQSYKFFEAKTLEEVYSCIDNSIRGYSAENALHEVLKLFVTTEDKSLAVGVKSYLRAIANEIYGESIRDGRREAFLEAICINIVYRQDLKMWDYEQWTDKENIEATEEKLF